ncbi:MAG TPA: ATP-binding protein [Actinocrinis sp.]|uniref:ATP-binding protein n=1 Tax=Actinocrinis sp. TaxID=1920516 RepID=UPI002DDD5AAD|nr:ATP-binding protein [Actinocrinis sp.]HEV2346104.1 ATP-binding protein [Actinocrinis sp.]
MPESLLRTLPGLPPSVREARSELRGFLADHTRVDAAELILSEFATNAVLHSRSRELGGVFEIRLELTPGTLRIEVLDEGEPTTVDLAPEDEALAPGEDPSFPYGESGRGLLLVDALADKWGHDSTPEGRLLWWAELWTTEERR